MNESLGSVIQTSDRRIEPRARAAYQIEYEYFSPAGAKTAEGTAVTVNMSGRGALIEVTHDLGSGGSMILCIIAPLYTMLFRAQIVHTRLSPNGLYLIGVQLTDVIEGRWETVEQLVQAVLEKQT